MPTNQLASDRSVAQLVCDDAHLNLSEQIKSRTIALRTNKRTDKRHIKGPRAGTPLALGNPELARSLRVGLGQNGQKGFISGEQIFLNVAGDSAKTLSVLENMGDALDDCRLRFVQKCRRPPQNTPDFGGPTDFFEKLPSKPPPRISPTWPT